MATIEGASGLLDTTHASDWTRYTFGWYASARHGAWQVGRVGGKGDIDGDDQLKVV